MSEKKVREGLIRRCEDLYREIKNRVRARRELGKKIWTGRRVGQKCLLSLYLFNLMTADIEEYLEKSRWEGK